MLSDTKRGPVLVVDDDPTIVNYIDMALMDYGFECIGAMHGEEAIRRVAEVEPSLILLDVSMPLMDGREFCRWLRANVRSSIPVIVMTAGQNAGRTCAEMGAQAYLAKPFDLAELQSCVKKWSKLSSQG